MASRPPRVGVPTFYLDHSTLCHAFRGGLAQEPGARDYASLFPWIDRVSREANLCLSQAHVHELAQWGDTGTADMLAEWLDRLETVWVPEFSQAQDLEAEYWVRVALGRTPTEPYQPFLPSMFSAVVREPAMLPGAIEARNIPGLLALFREVDTSDQLPHIQHLMRLGHTDRENMARAGISDQTKAQEMAYRNRVELRKLADAAHQRIIRRCEDLPLHTSGGVHVSDALVQLVADNASAMPSWRVHSAYALAWMDLVGSRTPGSKQSRALESSFGDYRHLTLGAAYCDVFTCDADVDRCLGDCRESLGLKRQLSTYQSSAADFVARLRATWP